MEPLQSLDDPFPEPFDPVSLLNFPNETDDQLLTNTPPVPFSVDDQPTNEPSNNIPSVHKQPLHEPSIEEPSSIRQQQAQLPSSLNDGGMYRTTDGTTLTPESILNTDQAYLGQPHPPQIPHLSQAANTFQNALLSELCHPSQISYNPPRTNIASTPFHMELSQMSASQTAQQSANAPLGTQPLQTVQSMQLNSLQTALSKNTNVPQTTSSPEMPSIHAPTTQPLSPQTLQTTFSQMLALHTAIQNMNLPSETQPLQTVQQPQLNLLQTEFLEMAPSENTQVPETTSSPHMPDSQTRFTSSIYPQALQITFSQMLAPQTAQQTMNIPSGTQTLQVVKDARASPLPMALSEMAPSETANVPKATSSTPPIDDPELAPFLVGPNPQQPQPVEFITTKSLVERGKRSIEQVENVEPPQTRSKRIRLCGMGEMGRTDSGDVDMLTAIGGGDTANGQGSLREAHGTVLEVKCIEGYEYEKKQISNPILCEICGKGFPEQESLGRHKSRSHADSNEEEVCDICTAKLKNYVNLIRHIEKIHNGVIKATCQECGAKFTSGHSYTRHTKKVHPQTTESAKKRAPQHARVKRPLKKDKTVKVISFNCRTCNHTSLTRSNVERHIRICHLEERKFACHCGKAFPTKDNLRCHQNSKNCSTEQSE